MDGKLRIIQKRSAIGRQRSQRLTIKALGLKRLNQRIIQPDTPQIRGMIRKVSHLVETVEDC
ncbi:MAG TPA: 50S ribosomal protein L30 [Candidatus Latescibacteria bacterium]|nr:50S ribosomal protein L30 [Candidatus Latescibacterota bacterium]